MTKEDWTLVTDRSQKKRIQNRVAQRTYRNRIKQRVEELEKEVSEYRRRAQQQGNAIDESQDGSVSGTGIGSRNEPEECNGSHAADQSAKTSASLSTVSSSSKSNGGNSTDDKAKDETSTSSTSSYAMDIDAADRDIRPSRDGPHEAPPTALMPQHDAVVQPQCLAQPGLGRPQLPPQLAFSAFPGFASPPLSQPYSLTTDWPWPNASHSVYRDSLGHQPLTGFTSLATGRNGRSEQEAGSDAPYHISPDATYIVQPGAQNQTHIPTPDGTMDLRTASADRSSDASSIGAASPSSSIDAIGVVPGGDLRAESLAKFLGASSGDDRQIQDRCIEDRFEFIRQCAASAGFGNFDAAVGQYYTADFSHESIISRDQRNSRHSELPLLLSELRNNVETWTQWEAHGYQYEIIKSAESIVRAERADLISSQEVFRDVLLEIRGLSPGATEGVHNAAMSRAFRPLAKKFQDTAPKLWALTESLVGSNDTVNQRQRSYTSLAIMLLLCCSDQASKSQMTALVTSCLNIAYGIQR